MNRVPSRARVFYTYPMRRSIALSSSLILVTISIALGDAPALNDLQQLFKQGDYTGVIKGAADALAPGGVSDPASRYKIALLDGEAQLRLRRADEAVEAFTAAAKEAEDLKLASLAKATAILIGRSKDFIYTSQTIKPPLAKVPPPKVLANNNGLQTSPATKPGATGKPVIPPPVTLPRGEYDIIEPAHRTEAMQALWTDERADAEKTIKEKIAQKTLPTIADALERIHQAEPVAIAAGSVDWSKAQKDSLANAARLDANTAMKEMNTELNSITKDQVKRRNNAHPRAMPQAQRDVLNKMTESLNQIAVSLKALPEPLGVAKETFAPQLEQADRLQDRATTVLATD